MFQGISEFFVDYLLPFETELFTGPTTSPENSYYFDNKPRVLSFSPAFDLPVLRQVANAYHLSVDLMAKDNKFNESMIRKHTRYGRSSLEMIFIDVILIIGSEATDESCAQAAS